MKGFESQTSSQSLNPEQPYIARIDGHHFSTFLKAFHKPNDIRVYNAMLNTTKDLVFHFKATCGFTQSDEITLIFTLKYTKSGKTEVFPNSGRVLKTATIMAGFTSTCFFKHLLKEVKGNVNLENYVMKSMPHFDCRIFNVPENYELVNNVKWRHNFDCKRNSISSLASKHLSFKVLKGLNSEQKIQIMLEKGVSWEAEPHWYKFGTFVKLERFDAVIFQRNKETKELERKIVKKFRPISVEKLLDREYNNEDEQFLLAPFIDFVGEPIDSDEANDDPELDENNNENNEDTNLNNEDTITIQNVNTVDTITIDSKK